MKMKHLHLALEVAGAAAILYILYYFVTKPADAAPAKAAETPSLKGSYSKARRPVKATVVKEPDSVVENDEGESEED